jgi:hypothetical protein
MAGEAVATPEAIAAVGGAAWTQWFFSSPKFSSARAAAREWFPAVSSRPQWPVIHLQRIYNFLLFHAIIVSILDVLYVLTSNFVSFFGTNLLP